ncbi:MAG: hypothetical protein P8P74_00655 [Crocinitomicaceae bacterium]|nr:hypothetical protein [Crocinitomicaceae bacterium]
MKQFLLIASFFIGLTVFSQTTITLPGEGNKTKAIQGEMLGEMIRSTGGVDKKSEKYYYHFSGTTLTIWKHIYLLEEDKTESLYITQMPLNEIDWAYLESSFPEGPKTKKVAGREYSILSINTQRGKRFKQAKYYLKSTFSDVTVGNVDINLMDAEALNAFHVKLLAAKK